jgi:hypothetical protein
MTTCNAQGKQRALSTFGGMKNAQAWSLSNPGHWPTKVAICGKQPIPLPSKNVLSLSSLSMSFQGAATMEWVTPQHEEIDLNCEISSYANAEL